MVFPAAQTSLSLLIIEENHFLKHMDLNVAIHPGKFETQRSHVRPETRGNASGTRFENKETSPVMPGTRGILVSKIAVVGRSETMTRTVERVSVVLASLAGSRSAVGRAGQNLPLPIGVTLHEVILH